MSGRSRFYLGTRSAQGSDLFKRIPYFPAGNGQYLQRLNKCRQGGIELLRLFVEEHVASILEGDECPVRRLAGNGFPHRNSVAENARVGSKNDDGNFYRRQCLGEIAIQPGFPFSTTARPISICLAGIEGNGQLAFRPPRPSLAGFLADLPQIELHAKRAVGPDNVLKNL
jgi:hypothetical protein